MDVTLPGSRYRNAALFITLASLWGGTYPAVKAGLEAFPPILLAALRLDIAAVLLLIYAAISFDYWWPRNSHDWLAVFAGGILTLAGYSVLLNIGQQTVSSSIAAILAGLIPLLTIGFAKLFLPDEDFGVLESIGITLGFVGLAVIVQPNPAQLLRADTVGQAVLVLAAASFALGAVLTQWVNASMPFAPRTAWALLVGALVTHFASYASASESVQFTPLSLQSFFAVVYLGIFVSAVGYLIYFDLLSRLGSVELNLVTYGAAMFGTLFSWILFDERVTAVTLVGFFIIMFGFVLLKREAFYEEYGGLVQDIRSGLQ